MKQIAYIMALGLVSTSTLSAAPKILCDFEDYEIGETFPLWNLYNGTIASTAVIEQDPTNLNNKVLHISLREWNTFVELSLPEELKGPALTQNYEYLKFSLYRSAADPCAEWKHFDIYEGDDHLYNDDGWPSQGGLNTWIAKSYTLNDASEENTATTIHLGFNSENTDYYIDNVSLASRFDDYLTFDNDTLNFCSNTSSYVTYDSPIYVPTNRTLNVFTSRYSYWMSPMAGSGRLNVFCGGERSYLGNAKGAAYPDWSLFTGEVHLYPYNKVVSSAGFYGLVLAHGGRTFNPEEVEESVSSNKVNCTFENNAVVLHEGASLACESGTRGFRFGELQMESGSHIYGYYKASTPKSYFLVGCSGSDAVLAGQIAPPLNNGVPYAKQTLGLIKEGKGTYRITSNDNRITGALRVLEGRVLINNDVEAASSRKMSGGVGTPEDVSTTGVIVYEKAAIGGVGNISALTDLYGQLQPGDDGIGTLRLCDFVNAKPITLRLRPTSVLNFEIASADSYDKLIVSGNLDYYSIQEDFTTSEKMPKVRILLPDNDCSLKVGDEFELITASSVTSLNDVKWDFDIRYPKAYTWQVEQRVSDGTFSLVAIVTSLEYGGQGDIVDPDDGGSGSNPGGEGNNPDDDGFDEKSDTTSLRTYASRLNARIGVAVPVWKFDISNMNLKESSLIVSQFNAVVAENEMKFDASEPNRGQFEYYDGDKLVNLAQEHGMEVRGHTLAWHSQVPSWLTSDGKKNTYNFSREELLSILKNHIYNVVGHYKGKVVEWDVVNECLDDDQSIIRTDPNGYTLRPSVWSTGIGADFIDSAFVYAHQADPNVKLYINDYGVEFQGKAKSEAYYNLVKHIKSKGLPIDGVGLQCHLTTGELDTARLRANIERYAPLDLKCIITELDIALADPSAEDALKKQADEYAAITRIAISEPNCKGLMIWGLSDNYSWRANQPLLYSSSLEAKPAYWSVHKVLRRDVATDMAEVKDNIGVTSEVSYIEYYNLQGLRLSELPNQGIVIEQKVYSDGRRDSRKLILRSSDK